MASCKERKHGYNEERFVATVNRNFLCSICHNVLKDPVLCSRNQHSFCRACITKYLETSQRCPTCAEELSVESLAEPQRIVKDYLNELNIRCNNVNRGCPEIVQLQHLEQHESTCVFSQVVCTNTGCGATLSKRDLIHHENEQCEYRKCYSSEEMTKVMADMEKRMTKIETRMTKIETKITKVDESVADMKKAAEGGFDAVKAGIAFTKDELQTLQCFSQWQQEVLDKIETVKDNTRYSTERANNAKENIIVLGSEGYNSVEMFNWNQRSWAPLQSMPEHHWRATSFVYDDHAIVGEGYCPGSGYLDTMIRMCINPVPDLSTRWSVCPYRMPAKLANHSSVLFNDELIVTGGCSGNKPRDNSANIHSVQLVPPYSVNTLQKMPDRRQSHSTEIFDDKILIIGGSTTGQCQDNVNSVLLFDIQKNEFKRLPPLPHAVSQMTTVKWCENIVVIGGVHKQGKTLDTVIMYNVKTGQRHLLPPMRSRRRCCKAVVVQNNIVVMGGLDEEGYDLETVEAFNFNRYTWEELPAMSEGQRALIAVVV